MRACQCGRVIDGRAAKCQGCTKKDQWKAGVFANRPDPPNHTIQPCRNCGRPISGPAQLCGACEWSASRPARLAKRKIREAFALDYETLTDNGWPSLVSVAESDAA